MKKKDFINHDWKEGEILYEIGYRHYGYYDIPVRVVRVRIRKIQDKTIFVESTNKKYADLINKFGYYVVKSARHHSKDIFFTKKEAEKCFKKKYEEFFSIHSERFRKHLSERLRWIGRERCEILGLMRMKILNN